MAGVGINPMFSPWCLFSASCEFIWAERESHTQFADKMVYVKQKSDANGGPFESRLLAPAA
jgi:hypothetical protein